MSQTSHQPSEPFYIGIDFHKHYSVFCVIDDRNTILERGRIDHKIPIGFELLIKRYPGCRVVRGVRHKFLIFNHANHAFESIKPKNWPRILTHWVSRSCRSVIAMRC